MKSNPILLKIIFWCEMIIAARVLVFTVPVLLNGYTQGGLVLAGSEGATVLTLTWIALYYFMTGLASALGLRGWRLFHYLGTVLTLVLVFSLIKRVIEFNASASAAYYIPVVLSIVLSLLVSLGQRTNQPPSQGSAKG